MKKHYFTTLEECFHVSAIVATYRFKPIPRVFKKMPPYDWWHITYIMDGVEEVGVRGETCVLKKGDVLFRAPREQHAFTNVIEGPGEMANISFVCESPWMEHFAEGKPFSLSQEERHLLSEVISLGVRSFDVVTDEPIFHGCRLKPDIPKETLQMLKLSLERFLLMLYVRTHDFGLPPKDKVEKTKRKNKELVSLCKEYMEEHIGEKLTIREIAHHIAVSESYLKQIFKEETGKSVIQYFHDTKISRAKMFLADGSMNISMIADVLGYSSPGYFGAAFKEKTGQSPYEYSKTHFDKE